MERNTLRASIIQYRVELQCRLIFAVGQCDAGAKTEFHCLLPVEITNWRGLSQIFGVMQEGILPLAANPAADRDWSGRQPARPARCGIAARRNPSAPRLPMRPGISGGSHRGSRPAPDRKST